MFYAASRFAKRRVLLLVAERRVIIMKIYRDYRDRKLAERKLSASSRNCDAVHYK